MAGILTPTQIFKDLTITEKIKIEDLSFISENGVAKEEFYILGPEVEGERVKIFTTLCKPLGVNEGLNAVIVVGKIGAKINHDLLSELCDKGYMAVGIDLSGEGKDTHTIYPEALSYARYSQSGCENTSLEDTVIKTCWFVWDTCVKYLFSYINSREDVNKIAVIGMDDGAVPVWHVLASGEKASGVVICSNAGWKGYKGNYKFLKNPEPIFTDEEFAFLAGVEPQAYAMHVKCPLYLLCPTNSEEYELDRAYDTITRLDSRVFTAINYSVGGRNAIDKATFRGAYKFLKEAFNKVGNKKIPLADEITVSLEQTDCFDFNVSLKMEGLKNLELYVAEKTIKPSLRCFRRFTGAVLQKNNKYLFKIPFDKINGDFVYFVKSDYQDYGICSMVYYLERSTKVKEAKQKVLFSSREESAERIFYPLKEGLIDGVDPVVYLKQGPKGMFGVTSVGGLVTFVVNETNGKPNEDSLLMLDAYIKDGGVLSVKLVTDYFGEREEYIYLAKISTGKIWQNVKITKKDFKTVMGKPLKDYEKIEALEISADEDKEFAINNLLWV